MTDLFGHRPDSWRIDPTEHPFASGPGRDDVRITTNYHPDSLESLFSTMHEYGHGLYSHQQPKHLERLPTGGPCSLGIHESQSRLWENLVGRSLPFWQLFYPRLQETYPEQLAGVDLERFHAGIHAVRPEPDPDPGRRGDVRDARDAPLRARAGHRRGPRRAARSSAALEREDVGLPRRRGARRRARRPPGRPLVGRVDRLLLDLSDRDGRLGADLAGGERDLPDLEDQVGRGEFAPLREWLGEHVHELGRKFSPQETLRRATGSAIAAQPYLDYLRQTYA